MIVFDIEKDSASDYDWVNVKYDNVPKNLKNYTRYMGVYPPKGLKEQGEIMVCKKNEIRLATKEEIELQEMKNQSIKYNL